MPGREGRRAGKVRPWILGVGMDPLVPAGEIPRFSNSVGLASVREQPERLRRQIHRLTEPAQLRDVMALRSFREPAAEYAQRGIEPAIAARQPVVVGAYRF